MPEEIAELKAGRCLGCPVPAIIDEENHAHDLLKAEQDGRLVVMPFQIGDSIYRIATVKKYVKHLRHTSYIKRIVIKPGNVHKYINEIGKTVYFTREEAEAAMKDGDRG